MPAEIVSIAREPPGVYGKLPARGDFITRRLDRPFVEAWDEWLRQGILACQETLGEQWLEVYLTSPIWRFALGAGCCGPNTVLGVVVPSVDKVGRYFPLMLGREIAATLELSDAIARCAGWYRAIEELALAALAPDFALDAFDAPLPFDLGNVPLAPEQGTALGAPGLHIALGDPRGAALRRAYQPLARGRCLWWSTGSARVAPSLLICPGMPAPQPYVSLLDGEWDRGGWMGVEPEPAAAPAIEASAEVATAAAPVLESVPAIDESADATDAAPVLAAAVSDEARAAAAAEAQTIHNDGADASETAAALGSSAAAEPTIRIEDVDAVGAVAPAESAAEESIIRDKEVAAPVKPAEASNLDWD